MTRPGPAGANGPEATDGAPTVTVKARIPRQERSTARRAALLNAAASVMTELGLGAVTHRSVAARAGVPFSAVGYYFTTIEDLLAATGEHLEHARAAYGQSLLRSTRRPATPTQAARLIVTVQLGEHRSDQQLQGTYSWLIQAGQHPALSAALRAARSALDAQLELALHLSGYRDVLVERVLNMVDGAVVLGLVEGHNAIGPRAERALAQYLTEAHRTAPAASVIANRD